MSTSNEVAEAVREWEKTNWWMYDRETDTWSNQPCPKCGSTHTRESKIYGGKPMKECLDCGYWTVVD